jgi:uncharacterized membrane protein
MRFLKATILGGLLFLVPVIILLAVLRHGLGFARKLVAPVARRFPEHAIAGVTVATLLAVGVLIVIALLAGLFVQTSLGRRIREGLEAAILGKVPGYSIIKGLLEGATGVEKADVTPALAWIEDSWVYAYVMEVHEDGHRTVFIPGSPNPMEGAVYLLPQDRLQPLDVPLASVVKSIRKLGIGSKDLLRGRLGGKTPA